MGDALGYKIAVGTAYCMTIGAQWLVGLSLVRLAMSLLVCYCQGAELCGGGMSVTDVPAFYTVFCVLNVSENPAVCINLEDCMGTGCHCGRFFLDNLKSLLSKSAVRVP